MVLVLLVFSVARLIPYRVSAGIRPGYTLTKIDVLEGGAYNEACGLNDVGQVVGTRNVPGDPSHAFLWENGQLTDLASPGVARAVNDSGAVVGIAGDTIRFFQHRPDGARGAAEIPLTPSLSREGRGGQ